MTFHRITTLLVLLSAAWTLRGAGKPTAPVYRPVDNLLVVQTARGEVRLPLGGQHLFVADKDFKPQVVDTFTTSCKVPFIERNFIYPRRAWLDNVTDVSLLTAGTRTKLSAYRIVSREPLILTTENRWATVYLRFTMQGDALAVTQTLVARQDGCFSLSTPCLPIADKRKGFKAVIPGYVHATRVNPDFVSAYVYEHGLPERPVLYQDKCATTPVSILQTAGLTLGVAPEKAYPRSPMSVGRTRITNGMWLRGHESGGNAHAATLLSGVGHVQIPAPQGTVTALRLPHSPVAPGWYDVYKRVVYGMYGFDNMRKTRNALSLSSRLGKIYRYMRAEMPHLFRQVDFEGTPISAQDYRGGVHGADNDAMKNADYGAMWMMVRLANDTAMAHNLLPFVRNFKLKQQFVDGQYAGAPQGQYFLWKSKRWVEEWGEHIEPIAITYYSIIDVANMLLFEPADSALSKSLRTSADLLLSMQRPDGSWPLGLKLTDGTPILPDLQDLRPTFYGMYVAYKMLGDEKYLRAAVRGTDWFIGHAVRRNAFVGVCGDTRFAPDFATGMSVQALLDMYELTENKRYREAALATARYFTTYIYTHPADTKLMKDKSGSLFNPLRYTQAGLACEHIGVIGSANPQGPILLSSFAGMFVRLYRQTGDMLFLDMARAAANGRDSFIDPLSAYRLLLGALQQGCAALSAACVVANGLADRLSRGRSRASKQRTGGLSTRFRDAEGRPAQDYGLSCRRH